MKGVTFASAYGANLRGESVWGHGPPENFEIWKPYKMPLPALSGR